MKKLYTFLALAALTASSFAQPTDLKIDSSHTFPAFEINHFGLSTQRGNFKATKGTAMIDEQLKKGALEIVIDTSSINTGLPALESHLKKPDFFDVEKYPEMTFKSSDFVFSGDKVSKINGSLTLKGITKPVTLTLTSFVKGTHPFTKKLVYGAEAYAVIKRSDFGITYGLPGLSDDVKILINVEAGPAN